MPQIFHPITNTIARVSIFGALFLVGGLLWVLLLIQRSSYVTLRGVPTTQPVPPIGDENTLSELPKTSKG
jgi:hypothetical protein